MRGKNTCKILKEIRRQIAEQNDIELVVSECTYQGDCLGTCPKCEAEVRYLERELAKRQALGKAAVFSGMAMSSLMGMVACGNSTNKPDIDNEKMSDTVAVSSCEPQALDSVVLSDTVSKTDSISETKNVGCYLEPEYDGFDWEWESFLESEGKEDTLDITKQTDIAQQPDTMLVEQDEEELLGVIEETPEFPGGIVKLAEYIYNNIKYPQEAIDAGIEGRVFLSFMVEEDGSITEVKVMKGLGYGCDEEAVRVVSNMPKWKPGKNWRDGKPTRFAYTLPVKFMLDENENE